MMRRALLIGAFSLMVVPALAGDLTISIPNTDSAAGTLLIGLYDSQSGFDEAIKRSTESGLMSDPQRVAGVALRASSGSQTITLGGIAPGSYAIIAYHDENDDGKLDVNGWEVPTEGYAFSNDARGFLGAPSFEAARFSVPEARTKTVLTLHYPEKNPTSMFAP